MEQNEQTKPTDFERLAYAPLALEFLEKGEKEYANAAEQLLIENLDYGKDGAEDIEFYKRYVSDEVRTEFIKMQYNKFQIRRQNSTVSKTKESYQEVIDSLDENQKQLVEKQFEGEILSKEYGKILETLKKSEKMLDPALKGEFHQDALKKAEENLKKYAGFAYADSLLMKYAIEKLRPKAIEKSKKEAFGNNLERMLNPQQNQNPHRE